MKIKKHIKAAAATIKQVVREEGRKDARGNYSDFKKAKRAEIKEKKEHKETQRKLNKIENVDVPTNKETLKKKKELQEKIINSDLSKKERKTDKELSKSRKKFENTQKNNKRVSRVAALAAGTTAGVLIGKSVKAIKGNDDENNDEENNTVEENIMIYTVNKKALLEEAFFRNAARNVGSKLNPLVKAKGSVIAPIMGTLGLGAAAAMGMDELNSDELEASQTAADTASQNYADGQTRLSDLKIASNDSLNDYNQSRTSGNMTPDGMAHTNALAQMSRNDEVAVNSANGRLNPLAKIEARAIEANDAAIASNKQDMLKAGGTAAAAGLLAGIATQRRGNRAVR